VTRTGRISGAGVGLALVILTAASAQPALGVDGARSPRWSVVAAMPRPREKMGVAANRHGVYAIGGDLGLHGCDLSCYTTRSAEVYSVVSGTWSAIAPMHVRRDWLAATAGLDGTVYAIGGWDADCGCAVSSVEAYDPSANTWAFVAKMPDRRVMAAATTGLDGRVYVIGGGRNYNSATTSVFAYTPSTNSWAAVASLLEPTVVGAAATGPDGRVYAVGGSTSEVYDPAADSWSFIASPPTIRGYVAATGGLGRIWLLGGCCPSGAVDEVDVYSPQTDSWSVGPPMLRARSTLGAALGPDGALYAVGGNDGGSPPTAYSSVEALSLTG
jgi:Kelch motif